MPEILNYTYETTYITVDANSSWNEADVDIDGIPDAGILPILVRLYPTNTVTHTISAWDFTISGSGPDMGEGAASGQPFFGWDLGGAMGNVTGWNQIRQFSSSSLVTSAITSIGVESSSSSKRSSSSKSGVLSSSKSSSKIMSSGSIP